MIDVDARAESLQEMMSGEGWQYVQDYIKQRIADHTSQLLTCKIDDVLKHRAKVEAYNSVLLYVNENSLGQT